MKMTPNFKEEEEASPVVRKTVNLLLSLQWRNSICENENWRLLLLFLLLLLRLGFKLVVEAFVEGENSEIRI